MTPVLLALALSVWQASTPAEPESELQTAIQLTRGGRFEQAIPHFLAARGHVPESFALEFNLALCYVGTRQYRLAIDVLTPLEATRRSAEIENLLAQAYIGDRKSEKGMAALKRGAAMNPKDEKLYVFVSDVCLEQDYSDIGIEIVNMGLQNLPESPRLLYQRALFESRLEEIDRAHRDFERARRISPDSDLGYVVGVEDFLLSGNIPDAIQLARDGVRKGHDQYMLLTQLGEALLRGGAMPGQSEFSEAQSVLERAVSEKPTYSSAQVAIGKLYLLENRVNEAIAHLELGRNLEPGNPSVYPSLAAAYRRAGEPEKARAALAVLQHLNEQQALRIASASGGHAGMAGGPR